MQTHQSDHRPVFEDLLSRNEAELECIGQRQLPDCPIENPEHNDSNSDKAIEIVGRRRHVTNLVGRAY